MKTMRKTVGIGLAMVMVMLACRNGSTQTGAPTPAPAAPAATPAPAAGATGIKGKVTFTGAAPAPVKLKREADPFCGKTLMNDEEVVVNPNATLKNVVVRVMTGAPAVTPPAEPVVMVDQNNCMYRPRVVAGVTGQKLLIKNSDPIMHNVHAYKGTVTGYNQAQMKGSKDIEKTVEAGVTKFKCDVHPWMTGYVVGNENAFVAVTGDSGEFTLNNVPAGTYTVEAWHEKYGAKTVDVTVAAGQTATADFSFSPQ